MHLELIRLQVAELGQFKNLTNRKLACSVDMIEI